MPENNPSENSPSKKPPPYYNCHAHIFTGRHLNDRLLSGRALQILRHKVPSWIVRNALDALVPWKKEDRLGRLAAFAGIGNRESQTEVFRELASAYPDNFRFVVLSLDTDYVRGRHDPAPIPFPQQIDELARLRDLYPERCLPFVCADPRRPGVLDLVGRALDQGFAGVKIYPALGYWPFDERLDPVYALCAERGVPVLTHCSRGGVRRRHGIRDEERVHPRTGARLEERSLADFTDHYTDPANYRPVFEKHPELRLCLAHYGGDDEWRKWLADPWLPTDLLPVDSEEEYDGPLRPKSPSWLSTINDLIRRFPDRAFTDLSYTVADRDFFSLAKILIETRSLGDHILFGSDYYMVRMEKKERAFYIDFRAHIGEDAFRRIAVENPKRFFAL